MNTKLNLVGIKKGRLTVVEKAGSNNHGDVLWKCKCECGNEITLTSSNILHHCVSCGCLKNEKARKRMTKHGLSNHPIYSIWKIMKRRCYDKNLNAYRWYGAKGIEVCDEWKNDASAFIEWALHNGWQKGLTIDRIDSTKNYEPSNCRWITRSENCRRRFEK